MRYLASYGVALLLILGLAAWLVSGTLIQGGNGPGNGERAMIEVVTGESKTDVAANSDASGEGNEEVVEAETVAAPQSVRVVSYSAKSMPIEIAVRGRTKANALVSVRAETTGILESVAVSKGQSVKPGDLLCTISSGTRRARLAQATAALSQAKTALDQAQADYETNVALRKKGVAPANTARSYEVAQSAAISGHSAAMAALDDAQTELARTEIRAEITGLIQEPLANVGDMLTAGGTCATIVQLNPMLFVGKVAEAKVSVLRNGLPASISTVTGQVVTGEVSFIASIADEATRSFTVEITIDNANGTILDGVTAAASISVGETKAHLLPQSVLTLDDAGTIGIKSVNDNKALFQPVTLVRDTPDGVWVAGLPDNVDVIILGQEFVTSGQIVAASLVDDEGANS